MARWRVLYNGKHLGTVEALRHNDLLRKAVLVILLQRTISLIRKKGYMMNK